MEEKELTPEEKTKALTEFYARHFSAMVEFKKRHPNKELPATWSPHLKKYIWVNRAERRKAKIRL